MNTASFFASYYNQAEVNSMLIMDCEGSIIDVNRAFTNNFGYTGHDLKGSNFRVLFTSRDQEKHKPQLELDTVLSKGQSYDENYVVDEKGRQIWCTGESILVTNEEGVQYIVKDIVNLQAKRQLEFYLTEAEVLLEKMVEFSEDIAVLILDARMRIQGTNAAFVRLFEIPDIPAIGSRLADLGHPFWNDTEIKKEITRVIVNGGAHVQRELVLETKEGENKKLKISYKKIDHPGKSRKIYIIIEAWSNGDTRK